MPERIPLNNPKLLDLADAAAERSRLREVGRRLVVTNGCFDLLHPGHIHALQQAAREGDRLWVLLNADIGVKRIKGPARPIQNEEERAFALAALACVDAVILFSTPDAAAALEILEPDVYVKSGDYTLESLNRKEVNALERAGARIRILPFLEGHGTTALIERILRLAEVPGPERCPGESNPGT